MQVVISPGTRAEQGSPGSNTWLVLPMLMAISSGAFPEAVNAVVSLKGVNALCMLLGMPRLYQPHVGILSAVRHIPFNREIISDYHVAQHGRFNDLLHEELAATALELLELARSAPARPLPPLLEGAAAASARWEQHLRVTKAVTLAVPLKQVAVSAVLSLLWNLSSCSCCSLSFVHCTARVVRPGQALHVAWHSATPIQSAYSNACLCMQQHARQLASASNR